MSEMRVVLQREIPQSEEFRRQWNGLVEKMERPEVFYTWEWAKAVAHAYGAALRPLLFAGYRGETLVGIAALAEARDGEICFLASTTADYCDFVSESDDRKELIELVLRDLRGMGFTELRLANLPAVSASAAVLRTAARMSGYSVFVRPAYLCAQIPLSSPEERQQVARSARRSCNKARNAFARMGQVAVDHKKKWEEFDVEFPEFARAQVARFLAAGHLSNLVRHERRAFIAELARLLSARGWLTLSTLKVDRRTIAWHLGFQFAGTWFSYLPTFDTELRHLHPGPGAYLLCQILQEASEAPEIQRVDLGLGDEGYKKQYAKAGLETLYITASRSKARLSWEACRYGAKSLLKRSPGIERAARKFGSGISSLRSGGVLDSLRHSGSRMARAFWGGKGVCFLEWTGPGMPSADDMRVQPVSAKLLAVAAMRYEEEDDTLQYLLRSARRLQSGKAEGFALVASDGVPVHFCWAAPFEGFVMPELGHALKQPAAHSVLMFDCWTPGSERGRGHYARYTTLVAGLMLENGNRAWIFSVGPSSTAGLERAGFVPRFSLVRKRKLFFSHLAKLEFRDNERPIVDLNPAA